MNYQAVGDPETHTRIQQYELAFRMQSSVPDLTDLANEPASTYDLYGDEAKKPGCSPTPPCWPAGWSSGASGSSRSTTTTGTPTATSPAACPASARTSTSPAGA